LTLGIAAGLFLGKQIGVMGATVLAVKTGFARLPEGVTWRHIYGIAALTGVGFTMSLFIGSLAFGADDEMNAVRLGVLLGSVVSGLFGYAILRSAPQKTSIAKDEAIRS
jgi:NhaA family Na+:H+ antiporter